MGWSGSVCARSIPKIGQLTVNDRKGIIHCFGCGWSGDLIGFYAEIRNIKPVEAIRILAADAGIDDPIARERLARQSREQAEHRDREQARAKQSDAVKLRNIFAARTPMGAVPSKPICGRANAGRGGNPDNRVPE